MQSNGTAIAGRAKRRCDRNGARGRALVVAVALATALAEATALAAPRAVLVEPAHARAGEVEPGQVQKYEWTLRNEGDSPLTILALEPTCYCTTGKADAMLVPPGGTTRIHLTIDPSDFVGRIVKGVEIETDDPRTPKQIVDVEVIVRPEIAVVPPELDFGAVPAAGSQERTVDLKAAKERPFKVTSVASDAPFVTVEPEPLQMEERVGVRLYVQVKPGAPPGPFAARIVVQTDDASRPKVEIPVRGTGAGGVSAEPARLVFEAASPGAEVGKIAVRSTKPLEVTGVRTSTPALQAELQRQPDGSYQVRVKLAPSAKPGRVMAKVILTTADAAQPEIAVPVMGFVR